jgi:hypothetical protein
MSTHVGWSVFIFAVRSIRARVAARRPSNLNDAAFVAPSAPVVSELFVIFRTLKLRTRF